jgi:hypothetical protein
VAYNKLNTCRAAVKHFFPIILGVDRDGHPIVPVRRVREGFWVVELCPYCGGEHHHGPLEGSRLTPCQPGGTYVLRLVG